MSSLSTLRPAAREVPAYSGKQVNLTDDELREADYIADLRHADAYLSGCLDKHGLDPQAGYLSHLIGARGEMAAAAALHHQGPLTVNTFKTGGDLGELQVRTRGKHWYDLLIRKDDADGVFILVTTEPRYFSFSVHGWIKAREARSHPEWQRTYGGRELAWFVPHHALHEMERIIHGNSASD